MLSWILYYVSFIKLIYTYDLLNTFVLNIRNYIIKQYANHIKAKLKVNIISQKQSFNTFCKLDLRDSV